MAKARHGRRNFAGVIFKIALVVFLIAAGVLVYLFGTYYYGQKQYDDLKSFTDIEAKTLGDVTIDWDALSEINPDIVGWVYVPDTVISYPIVWKKDDNAYYLNHNFNNKSTQFGAEYGCIFLAGTNNKDWSDNSNFVFGHNMWNGSVFSVFSDEQGNSNWFNKHRLIYVFTPQGNYALQTYAENKVDESAKNIFYSTFPTTSSLQEYVDTRKAESIVTPDPPAKETAKIDRLFTFSTCSSPDDDKRIVVFSDVLEYYDFYDQTKNINIAPGTKGSAVSQQTINTIADTSASRQQ